jgi:hypothetical protein
MRRDIYAVLVTSTNGITPRAYSDDTHTLVSDLVTRLILVHNHPVTPEDIRACVKPISDDLGRYEVWSWDAQSIPLQARAGQIPKPGVFFIIEVSLINENNGGLDALLLAVKKVLSDDGGPSKFQRHLAGPWSHWTPRPLSTFDVLLSASAADDTVAIDIEKQLVARGLSTVRSIRPAGDFGDETLRRQLLECQMLLSVLTPSSVHDPRVAIETGACWVLAKPFVPVLSKIAKTELPPSMAARQCVEAGDAAALDRLPEQIKLLVLGR